MIDTNTTIDNLTITNNLLFSKFMKDEEICRTVLNDLLPFEVGTVKNVNYEKTIFAGLTSRGVRLDVYAQDDENKVYNIEMQVTNNKNLPLRVRYYQSCIDLELINKGEDYIELKDSIIIVICTFDPFGAGLPCYTFKNVCEEDNGTIFKDGRTILFFNAEAFFKEQSEKRRDFLAFICGKEIHSEQYDTFNKRIQSIKNNEEFRREYMLWTAEVADARRESEAKGIAIGEVRGEARGIAIGKLETARNLLGLLDDTVIAKTTGLPLSDILSLKKEAVN